MILKVSVLVVAVFVQANEVLSQGQYKQPYGGFGKQNTQMWDPSSWDSYYWDPKTWAPYIEAASKMWMDYMKQAAENPNQWSQWYKRGAVDMYNPGMNYAEQMARDAQNQAEEAMRQAQGAIPRAF